MDSAEAPLGAEEARRCRRQGPAGRHEVAGAGWPNGGDAVLCHGSVRAGKRADLRQSAWRGRIQLGKYIKCCRTVHQKRCGRESRRPISEERESSFEFLEKGGDEAATAGPHFAGLGAASLCRLRALRLSAAESCGCIRRCGGCTGGGRRRVAADPPQRREQNKYFVRIRDRKAAAGLFGRSRRGGDSRYQRLFEQYLESLLIGGAVGEMVHLRREPESGALLCGRMDRIELREEKVRWIFRFSGRMSGADGSAAHIRSCCCSPAASGSRALRRVAAAGLPVYGGYSDEDLQHGGESTGNSAAICGLP